jgi:general nucleoside transport system permease protein
MRQIFTLQLLFSTVRLSTPLVLAALGGLYSERSGVINIALEGLLLSGAFTAASVTYYAGSSAAPWLPAGYTQYSPWVGLAAAILAGALVAYIIALACIRFKADQVVTGTGINILFIGLPAVLSGALFLSSGSTPQIPRENLLPALYRFLPFMPPWRIFTDVSVISLLALVVVLVTRYVLYRTPFGLRLRAVGENPEAADAAGVGVNRMRYIGVILSGALAGIGGAYLSIGQSSLFTRNMAAGRGFIALAALIFGKWRPTQTMLACLLFGFADALTIQMQGVVKLPWNPAEDIPVQFIQMIPYVVTIVVLAGFIGQSRAPRALGTAYEKAR